MDEFAKRSYLDVSCYREHFGYPLEDEMARNLSLVSQEKVNDWCMANVDDPLAVAYLDANSAVDLLKACTSIGAWSELRKVGEGKADHLAMSSAARDGRDAIGRGILKNINRLEKCRVSVKS